MTTGETMSREELLELAALDAFGLLEEFESALYTRSFHDSPAAVQEEVLELQARLSSDEKLLPSEQPDPALRQKVLEAVARAIDSESAGLKPLATIGRRTNESSDGLGSIHLSRSGQFWRAAAFMLAGVVIVIAYLGRDVYKYSQTLARLAILSDTREELKELIGPTFEDFLTNPRCQTRALLPVDDTKAASVVFFFDARSNQAFLLAIGFPHDEPGMPEEDLTLVARTSGGAQTLSTFKRSGGLIAIRLADLDAQLLATATLEISTSAGVVLYRST